MALASVIGVDHVMIVVRDLDAAAARWRGLGFTLSPRGTHSPKMGSANYTIMFPDDYLELLGILVATDQNQGTRDFLAQREGIDRTAFTARDAAAGVAELKARGVAAVGPVDFNRPVDMPDGRKSEARFTVFRWPQDERPGGMGLFACQHHTRDTVFIPEISRHANGATRIAAIEIVAADPAGAAKHMQRLVDQPVRAENGVHVVPSGSTRADFIFTDPAGLAARYPAAALAGATKSGAAVLTLATRDLAAAKAALGAKAIPTASGVVVAASEANGVILNFVKG